MNNVFLGYVLMVHVTAANRTVAHAQLITNVPQQHVRTTSVHQFTVGHTHGMEVHVTCRAHLILVIVIQVDQTILTVVNHTAVMVHVMQI